MKTRNSWGALFLVFAVFAALMTCRQKRAEWKGTIETKNGVQIITNPKQPIHSDNIFELEEELCITGGNIDQEEWMFQDIVSLAVSEDQFIFALDVKAANIKVFDRFGQEVKVFGRPGQGPGELSRPENISFSPQQEIVVEDTGRRLILFYDQEGRFLRQWPLNWVFYSGPKFTSLGEPIVSYALIGKKIEIVLNKLDSDLKPIVTYTTIPLDRPPKVHVFLYRFYLDLRWGLTPADEIIWGSMTSPKYELFVHDRMGNLIKKITKEYNPVEITQEEYEKLTKEWFGGPIDQFDFIIPKNYPPFHTFLLDDEGRIFVRRFEKVEDSHRHFIEVFDSQGRYLTNIILPLEVLPSLFFKGKLYTIEETGEGFEVIKRYRTIWRD